MPKSKRSRKKAKAQTGLAGSMASVSSIESVLAQIEARAGDGDQGLDEAQDIIYDA